MRIEALEGVIIQYLTSRGAVGGGGGAFPRGILIKSKHEQYFLCVNIHTHTSSYERHSAAQDEQKDIHSDGSMEQPFGVINMYIYVHMASVFNTI